MSTNYGADFLYRTHFGFVSAPSQTNPDEVNSYARVLLSAVDGDGHITPLERAWIKGYLAAKGYPTEVVDGVDSLTALPASELASTMDHGTLRFAGRVMIYDAVRAASADRNYHPQESATIHKIATALGVAGEVVKQIEALVAQEEASRALRVALLFPDGHPNLPK